MILARPSTAVPPLSVPKATTPASSAGRQKNLLSTIGDTPLLDISSFAHARGVSPEVALLAKAEWFNPGGSIKTRAAYCIVKDAIDRNLLSRRKTLIDSSSGNTGIAFALIGAALGFPVTLVMPANVSVERKAMVKAYGATLIESDPLEGSDGAIQTVRRLVHADPDRYYYADQYNNPANWYAHYDGTGPEIWRQTNGSITHFVSGLGTSGTFMGVGRYLKKQNPDIQLIALQPEDGLSVIEGLKHMQTAIKPGIYDESLADRTIDISAESSWTMTRLLASKCGLFVGLSSGAAVTGAIEVGRSLRSGVIVTVLPDDGSKYLSLGLFD